MKTLLLIGVLVLSASAFSQATMIQLSTEQNSDRTISIYADNMSNADYTIKLTLTLTGLSANTSNPALIRVPKGHTQIARLTPDKMAAMPGYRYAFQYFPGYTFRKAPDTSNAYLLPSTEKNALRVSRVNDIRQTIGQVKTSNFFATGFSYHLGDTICAARGGLVYETYDGATTGEKSSQTFSHDRNTLNIEHKDGTLSHYSVLSPIKLLVTDGQYVVPGQPLAVFNKESDKYTVLYSVRYLDEKKVLEESGPSNSPAHYVSLHPLFYAEGSAITLENGTTYVVAYSKDIIGKELSKKDRKKLGLD